MSKSQEEPKAFEGFAPWTLISQEPSLLLRAAATRLSEQMTPFCTVRALALLCRALFQLRATSTAQAAARRAGEEVWRPCYTGHITVLGMLHLGTSGREGATRAKERGENCQKLPPRATKGKREQASFLPFLLTWKEL